MGTTSISSYRPGTACPGCWVGWQALCLPLYALSWSCVNLQVSASFSPKQTLTKERYTLPSAQSQDLG